MRGILALMAVLVRSCVWVSGNSAESPSTRPSFLLSIRSSTVPPPTVFRSNVTPIPARRGKVDSPMLNYIFDSYATSNKHFHDKFRPPSFEGNMTSQDTAVYADTGSKVTFTCRVTSLRDKTVSWLRVLDEDKLQLLTLDLDTHAADPRYRVDVAGDNWKMSITDAKVQDSGIYCCHVSTHPPMLKRFRLTVRLPEIKMISETFLERGEMLSLKCSVLHLDPGESVPEMRWFRGSNYTKTLEDSRGGVLIETDYLTMTSHLKVARLKPADAGNYTCALEAPLRMKTVTRVHVLHGSSLAELQSGVKTSSSFISSLLICAMFNIWNYGNFLR